MKQNKPLVAVVGRPNVGKSTFFNKICGKRISIVKDVPGVTRDRIYADAEWCGYNFTLIDTGGIEPQSTFEMYSHVQKQAEAAIDIADVIIFMVDGKDGLISTDFDVANMLRQSKKPVILTVNKLDNFELEKTFDFYQLGLGEPFAISCEQAKGLGDLLDEIVKNFERIEEPEAGSAIKIAIVGKPNVGKSSLVNKILGFERVIVSDIAGTTRDSIDTPFTHEGQDYIIIDTAGMRRKRGIERDSVEDYSIMRSIAAIKRADIVLVVIDASEDFSEQDVKICGLVDEYYKPSVIVVNKWDKVEKDTFTIESFTARMDNDLAFMKYYRSIFVSAATGQRVEKILAQVKDIYENNCRRITTGTLNDVIFEAVSVNEPSTPSGKRLKILFSTQSAVSPPTFVIFTNDASLVHRTYQKYLENSLRKAFDFSGTPVKMIFRNRKEED